MKIVFTLNGKAQELQLASNLRLSSVLRDQCNQKSIKPSGFDGLNGYSLIIFDGSAVPSSIIPVYAARDAEIWTMEGLQSKPLVNLILKAFKEAEASPCDYCAPSRIIAVYAALIKKSKMGKEDMFRYLNMIRCRCCDYTSLEKAFLLSIEMSRGIPVE